MDATREAIAARLDAIVGKQGAHLDSALLAAVVELYPHASPQAWAMTVKLWRQRVFHLMQQHGE